jgi:TonB family protein
MTLRARRAGRRIAPRSIVVAALVAGVSCAAAREGSGPDGMAQLATVCVATLKSPKLLATSPVALPDAVWNNQSLVRALVSFRLDRTGHPTNVLATAAGLEKEAKPLFERAVVDAFKRYVFCPAGDFSTTLSWTARLLFSPAPAQRDDEDIGLYLQSFVPGYVGVERLEQRSGRVVVRGVYGTDGRPRSVEVVESSGDKVLDDQSLDAMASARILFRDGAAPSRPVRIERPFTYLQP